MPSGRASKNSANRKRRSSLSVSEREALEVASCLPSSIGSVPSPREMTLSCTFSSRGSRLSLRYFGSHTQPLSPVASATKVLK